jgi:hypothetical protein
MREIKFRAWCSVAKKPYMRKFDFWELQLGAFALHDDDKVMQYTDLED